MGDNGRFNYVITITPPLTLAGVKDGPELRTIELVHLLPNGNFFLGLPWTANAIKARDSGMHYRPHFIVSELQQVLEYYADRTFTGFIEARNSSPDMAPIFRYHVRDRRVVMVAPELVWPDDEADMATCPKCETSDIATVYGTQGTDEWLTRRCGNCRHLWQIPTGGRSDTGPSSDWRKQ